MFCGIFASQQMLIIFWCGSVSLRAAEKIYGFLILGIVNVTVY